MAQNPYMENTFAADKDNLIYVGKRVGGDMKDPNGHKEIRKVISETNNTVSISANDEKKVYGRAVKCMKELLEHFYDSHNSTDRADIHRQLESDQDLRSSLRKEFLQNCWIQTMHRNRIDFSYMLHSSIVDSDELYSYTSVHASVGLVFRIFDILGYEKLLVVGAYRRYAEWLISAYTESIKDQLEAKDQLCNKLSTFLDAHIGRTTDRKKVDIRFRVRFYDAIATSLPEIVEMGPSKMESKILNYFQLRHKFHQNDRNTTKAYSSITAELYCDSFGMDLTPHTCAHAQRIELEKVRNAANKSASSLLVNKGVTSDAMYQQIAATGYIFGYLLPTDEELKVFKERSKLCAAKSKFWCDSLRSCLDSQKSCTTQETKFRTALDKLTSGGNRTIVGTNSSNITMYKDLANYHTGVHKRYWMNSLPILCPSKRRLEEFLEKSLAMEQLVMPEFYASPLGKEEHIRMFWNEWYQKKKLFCWVDRERLFGGATSWNEIIDERMVSHDWGEPIEYS